MIYSDKDTVYYILIRHVAPNTLLIMKNDLLIFLIDNNRKELKAASDAESSLSGLWFEFSSYETVKDLIIELSKAKTIELRVEGRKGFRDAKFDKDNKKILKAFIKKYISQ